MCIGYGFLLNINYMILFKFKVCAMCWFDTFVFCNSSVIITLLTGQRTSTADKALALQSINPG